MPYLDGFQVMEQLHEFEKDSYAPILVLTTQSDRNTRLCALAAEACDYIEKPFDITEAIRRISNMLEIRLLHNQVRDPNNVLELKVIERTQGLDKTRQEAILRLGRAAEYRDNESGKDFEPYLVKNFKNTLPEMIRIVQELPDDESASVLKVYRKDSKKEQLPDLIKQALE